MYFVHLHFSIFFYYQFLLLMYTAYVAHETIIIKRNYEEQIKQIIKILFDAIRTYLNEKTIVNGNRTKCIRINKMRKKVLRWSYKFIDEFEQLEGKNEAENYQIRSRKAKRVVKKGLK
ncbi:hypothetical protein AAZX31_01G074000 [Glycine max]